MPRKESLASRNLPAYRYTNPISSNRARSSLDGEKISVLFIFYSLQSLGFKIIDYGHGRLVLCLQNCRGHLHSLLLLIKLVLELERLLFFKRAVFEPPPIMLDKAPPIPGANILPAIPAIPPRMRRKVPGGLGRLGGDCCWDGSFNPLIVEAPSIELTLEI